MKKICLGALCWWFGCLTGVQAGEVMDLGRIVVTPEVSVEGSRAAANVTVITRQMIERSSARTVADVLDQEAGVHVYDKGSAKTAVVDIGGYGDTAVSNVLVLVNGRRTNPVDISGADLLQVPLGSVEHIEIIRGGASVLYGDNAAGGVINIITRKGTGLPAAVVSAEAGSYGFKKYGTGVSGWENGLSYDIYSEYSDTDGYRDNSQVLAKDATARGIYAFNPQVKLGIEGGWHEDDYGLPGGLSAAELHDLGRRGTADPDDFGSTKDRFVRFYTDLMPFDAEHGTLTLDLSRRNRDTYGWYDYGLWGATATKRGIQTDTAGMKYMSVPKVFGRDLGLTAGVDLSDARNHILGSGAGMSASTDDLTISKKELGIYGLGEYAVTDDLFINAGVRQERAKYIFDRDDVPFYASQSPRETLFSGGIRYEYARRSSFFMSAQETFRFLATDEWYDTWNGLNTGLKQQTGVEYRAGIRHAFGERMDVRVMPFCASNRNEIFFDPTIGGLGKNSNYDRTRRTGIDLGQTFHMLDLFPVNRMTRLDLSADYTFQDPVFDGGAFAGNIIPMVPRHTAVVSVGASWKNGLAWDTFARYTGAQYAINDTANATARVKPSLVMDTRVGYTLKNGTDVYLGVNNIFDEMYDSYVVKSASGANKDYFPAPGRNYVVGVKRRF